MSSRKVSVKAQSARRFDRGGTRKVSEATKSYVKGVVSKDKPTDVYDTTPTNAGSVNSTGTLTALAPIPQGDGSEQRPGNKVKLVGVRLQGFYKSNTNSAATTVHILRVVLFRWKPDNNVDAPSLAKLFEDTGNNLSMLIDDRAARSKFQVLADYTRTFNSVNNGGGSRMALIKRRFMKVNRNLYYNDEATTGRGQVYLLEWGNSASGNEDITGDSYARVLYKKYH